MNPISPAHRRRTTTLAALTTLTLVGVAPTATAVPPGGPVDRANGAKVKVSPTTVKRGGTIKVSGTNWKSKGSRVERGAKVTVKLNDSVILAVLPIRNKKFSGKITIPRQLKPGRYWLRFLAAKPATSVKSGWIRVR